jgi:hypothetical protein
VPAFFLTAINIVPAGPGSGSEPGWVCAVVATGSLAGIFKGSLASAAPDTVCLMLSGLVNPLLLVYLVFCLWPRFVRVRVGLAVVILIGLVATWWFFNFSHFVPAIGHYLWVAGILVILGGELARWLEKRVA